MGTLNYFKKCFSLCTDGKTGNRKAVAPKSTLFFSLFKKTLPLLLFFFCTTAFSQSPTLTETPISLCTEITISPSHNIEFCPQTPFKHELTSNLSTGITGSEEFQWYKSDPLTPTVFYEITGAISHTYTITNNPSPWFPIAGIYKLNVIDKNLCEVYSQEIVVSEDCNPVVPCTVSPNPNIVLSGS